MTFIALQTLRTTGTDNLGLKSCLGIVWHVTWEGIFAILPLATRWGVVHMTVIQLPVFAELVFGRSEKHQGREINRLALWSGSPPGSSLPLYSVVSIHLFKVLGGISYHLLIQTSLLKRHGSLVFSCLCLFLDKNYRKSFFVERPHPLLFGCKSKMLWSSLKIS